MERHIVIRADANARIGTGHLMRCLALAQGWKSQGGQALFITACESDSLCQRLSDESFQVVRLEQSYPDSADWEITSQVLTAHSDAWVVLDGYHFDAAYQCQIKETGHRLLVIDDMAHLDHYYADIVLNQNINAERLRYACEPYTHLLLGTRYVLLRSEFLAWRGRLEGIHEVARKVLVTLGGSDPDNVTLKIIQSIQHAQVDGLRIAVVAGADNPHYEELQSAARDSHLAIHLRKNVANMPELMAWADVAVAAGGSTTWELAFMGLPAVVLELATNQQSITAGLSEAGIVLNLGWHTEASIVQVADTLVGLLGDLCLRRQMSQRGRELVDGLGSERVVKFLQTRLLCDLASS